jgi:hypothetical protein
MTLLARLPGVLPEYLEFSLMIRVTSPLESPAVASAVSAVISTNSSKIAFITGSLII